MPNTCQPAAAKRAVSIASVAVAPLLCALAVLGGIGSFATVRDLARPWFGSLAWIIPVGVDLGILALLTWDLLAEHLGLSWPVLRWTAWAFIAATVYLNIAAAHGNLTAAVMHAAMPVLFVTIIDGVRHLIRQYTGLAAGTRIERVPLPRWLLAPRTTFLLARRMILWHVTSYRDGLALEYQRLVAISQLQQDYGRWQWRWRAPLQERLALRLMPTQAADIQPPATGQPDLAIVDDGALSIQDHKLVEAARDILSEAQSRGEIVSQAALARRLRAAGHSIGNGRLRWLVTRAKPATSLYAAHQTTPAGPPNREAA